MPSSFPQVTCFQDPEVGEVEMGDVGTSDLMCITLAREMGQHVDIMGGKLKQRAKDFNRSSTSSTNGEQAIYSPFHSHSPSFPPPPPTTTSTKASKISLGLLTKEMDDKISGFCFVFFFHLGHYAHFGYLVGPLGYSRLH